MVPKPQGSTTAKSLTHRPLPPLPKLRVRRPNKPETNPCLGVMASVLGCWASSGYSVQGCAQFEQKLRQCMDSPVCYTPLSRYANGQRAHVFAEKPKHGQEQHQLPSLPHVSQDRRSTQARLVASIPPCPILYSTCISTVECEHHRVSILLGVRDIIESLGGVLVRNTIVLMRLQREGERVGLYAALPV
jgi:hypothetical protein